MYRRIGNEQSRNQREPQRRLFLESQIHPRLPLAISGVKSLTNAFDFIAMEKEDQNYQRQKNIIGFCSVKEIISQPRLNEINDAAFEADQIRMNRIRLGWRPLLNGIGRRHLRHNIDGEKRKDNFE